MPIDPHPHAIPIQVLETITRMERALAVSYDQQVTEQEQRQQQKTHDEPIKTTIQLQREDGIKLGFAGYNPKKRRSRAAPPGRCHDCNRSETPEWRRGPDGARTLCNACGLHYAKLIRKDKNAQREQPNLNKSSAFFSTPADGNSSDSSGSGTVDDLANASDNTIMDGNVSLSQGLSPGVDALSENTGYLPLSSQTSAAIFREAQAGLERLLVDLQSFDDGDIGDDLPVASGLDSESYHSTPLSSSETSEPEDACDGDRSGSCPKGSEAGSQEAPDSTSQGAGADDQGHSGSNRKRQRVEDGSDECPCTTAKTKRKRPISDKEQRLICCFRDDSRTPCSGTDKSICEVIERLATSHNTFICKTCYVSLTENESGGKVHPVGVDCIEQCLSPRCLEGRPTTVDQKHRFDTKSCGTKTGRPRPEDRESIYRYIFRLVHPVKEAPVDVFTTEKTPHRGMITRQGNLKATRDELESRVRRLSEKLEELGKRDSASTRQIDVLTRNLETERTKNTNFEGKIQRLQDVIADAIRPGALSDEHWRRSILQRVKGDAPDVLGPGVGHAPMHAQVLDTPPESLHDTSQTKSTTLSTPDESGLAGQDLPSSRDMSSLQPLGNNSGRHEVPSMADGDLLARFVAPASIPPEMPNSSPAPPYNHGIMRNTTLSPPFGPFLADATKIAPPQDLPGLIGQWRHDTPSGDGWGVTNTDTQNGARTVLPPRPFEDQAWTEDMWDGYFGAQGQ
jgi:hypothetical protein